MVRPKPLTNFLVGTRCVKTPDNQCWSSPLKSSTGILHSWQQPIKMDMQEVNEAYLSRHAPEYNFSHGGKTKHM